MNSNFFIQYCFMAIINFKLANHTKNIKLLDTEHLVLLLIGNFIQYLLTVTLPAREIQGRCFILFCLTKCA